MSVSTRTKTQLRSSAFTTTVRIAVIFMARIYRPVSDWRRMRRSMTVCSTTEMTMTRPKASWV